MDGKTGHSVSDLLNWIHQISTKTNTSEKATPTEEMLTKRFINICVASGRNTEEL